MAASDLLDIWNAALLNIGSKAALASVTEQSAEAAACALRYPSIVRTVLRDTDWNCVRRRADLVQVSSAAAWPPSWTFMYRYPADCLKVRGFDMGPEARFPNWQLVEYEVADDETAGRVILMDLPDPVLIYTSFTLDMTDGTCEAKFDAALREALGWMLAAAIAGPLTGSRSTVEAVRAEARTMLDAARAANATESTPNSMDIPEPESLAVRGFRGRGPYWGL